MTKQFSLLQLFSLADGRLSTNMGDVYDMLSHICDAELMTHHLPSAKEYLMLKNPEWFVEVKDRINIIKKLCDTNDFRTVTDYIAKHANDLYNIPQLKDEFDTSDFSEFISKSWRSAFTKKN